MRFVRGLISLFFYESKGENNFMVSTKITIFFKFSVCSELYINLSLVLSENTHLQVICSLVELKAYLERGDGGKGGKKKSGHILL